MMDLENYGRKNPTDAASAELFDNMGTHFWAVTRELLILGHTCGWDPANAAFKDNLRVIFDGPASTAATLECGFNHVKDSARQSKSQRMSCFTRYSYLVRNPTVRKDSGLQTFDPITSCPGHPIVWIDEPDGGSG